MRPSLQHLFETEALVARRSHPELARSFDGLLSRREIDAILPGIYALPGLRAQPAIRIAALRLYEPDAILLEHAAAQQSFWPDLPVDLVSAAVPRSRDLRPKDYRLIRRQIPLELVEETDGLRRTSAALTALDLGADAVDFALRTQVVTLDHLHEALVATSRHRGNLARRLLLHESSGRPWSAAERAFHRLLRESGIDDWVGNLPVVIQGSTYVIDVAFTSIKLAIEIDGRWFHGDDTFESDRWRQNAIALAGWRILRFTWLMIEDSPHEVLSIVEEALGVWGNCRPRLTARA